MSVQLVKMDGFFFGIPEKILPLRNPPEGRVKYRFRCDDFPWAIVRDATGHCRWGVVKKDGDGFWTIDFNVGKKSNSLGKQIRELKARVRELESQVELEILRQGNIP